MFVRGVFFVGGDREAYSSAGRGRRSGERGGISIYLSFFSSPSLSSPLTLFLAPVHALPCVCLPPCLRVCARPSVSVCLLPPALPCTFDRVCRYARCTVRAIVYTARVCSRARIAVLPALLVPILARACVLGAATHPRPRRGIQGQARQHASPSMTARTGWTPAFVVAGRWGGGGVRHRRPRRRYFGGRGGTLLVFFFF